MRPLGQPESAPAWYRDRGQSYIEKQFSAELGDLADLIESEHWFGDTAKHARYRVDFILKDARLIIELDGHEYHSTKEQLEKDAIRQRYLTRAGYSVIRFTGREINRDPAACVREVREMYKERIQRAPVKYRVLYIDYQFLIRQMSEAMRFYKDLHPDKSLRLPSLDLFITHAVGWLHEKSFITAFVFVPPEDEYYIKELDGQTTEYDKGEVRINVLAHDLYSVELGVHMENYAHLFDEFYLVADDPIYVLPLRSVLSVKSSDRVLDGQNYELLEGGKLLRKGNDETSFVGTDLARVRWQNVWYPIGAAMGLASFEL
ncbi:endonuclease domain-containing protein [Novosphingobium mangrovi (ex Huang et al. 2023)]|uniref:Endonuclease domain-containing protein n=1 Tax=Novosphingobium mangrovi (ex Huang et al. 2023) TaxID=2976432 RepID=A0ABT2I2Q3_9SPHN|nr:endonuclease domain-containing protein [Novosphingobium mangrovi (ex Huang et al. 2023)]MCT2399083.1 endonuclease domain-containing protein [Novosphingobium mangrovi (ex Huang et al. 2023)]